MFKHNISSNFKLPQSVRGRLQLAARLKLIIEQRTYSRKNTPYFAGSRNFDEVNRPYIDAFETELCKRKNVYSEI